MEGLIFGILWYLHKVTTQTRVTLSILYVLPIFQLLVLGQIRSFELFSSAQALLKKREKCPQETHNVSPQHKES